MRRARLRQRGIALLMVLWVFTILGVIALDFGRYMRDDAMAGVNFADETQGYYAAVAGMNKTLWQAMVARDQNPTLGLGKDNADRTADDEQIETVPIDGQWHDGEFAGVGYKVRLIDEEGRISLNRAEEPLLKHVLTNMMLGPNATARGVKQKQATEVDEVVDAILDWRDPDSIRRLHGAEQKYYLAERGYPPKNGFFDDITELLRVRGVTAALFFGTEDTPGMREVFSVHSRNPGVNIRSVTGPVLQALLGIDADEAAYLIDQRGQDPIGFETLLKAKLAAAGPTLEDPVQNDTPHTLFIEAQADTKQPRNQSHVAAVVELAADEFEGPRILRWFDRAPFDGGMPHGQFAEPAA